jgi:hypothetical protein
MFCWFPPATLRRGDIKIRVSRVQLVEIAHEPSLRRSLHMETLVEFVLIYVAIGAVLFALIPGQALPTDFHWRSQAGAFRDSLPEVLAWPVTLWRFCRDGFFLD